jgi:hypothetical protein
LQSITLLPEQIHHASPNKCGEDGKHGRILHASLMGKSDRFEDTYRDECMNGRMCQLKCMDGTCPFVPWTWPFPPESERTSIGQSSGGTISGNKTAYQTCIRTLLVSQLAWLLILLFLPNTM